MAWCGGEGLLGVLQVEVEGQEQFSLLSPLLWEQPLHIYNFRAGLQIESMREGRHIVPGLVGHFRK